MYILSNILKEKENIDNIHLKQQQLQQRSGMLGQILWTYWFFTLPKDKSVDIKRYVRTIPEKKTNDSQIVVPRNLYNEIILIHSNNLEGSVKLLWQKILLNLKLVWKQVKMKKELSYAEDKDTENLSLDEDKNNSVSIMLENYYSLVWWPLVSGLEI